MSSGKVVGVSKDIAIDGIDGHKRLDFGGALLPALFFEKVSFRFLFVGKLFLHVSFNFLL